MSGFSGFPTKSDLQLVDRRSWWLPCVKTPRHGGGAKHQRSPSSKSYEGISNSILTIIHTNHSCSMMNMIIMMIRHSIRMNDHGQFAVADHDYNDCNDNHLIK